MSDKIKDLRAKWLAKGCGAAEEFDAIVELIQAVNDEMLTPVITVGDQNAPYPPPAKTAKPKKH